MQSEHIRERISLFGGKLYLEFGGKLFRRLPRLRVLPGFQPDSKIRMLQQLRDDGDRDRGLRERHRKRTSCAATSASATTTTACA